MSVRPLPEYVHLFRSGELARRARAALSRLQCCRMCPRQCQVNRLEGELGECRTGRLALISSVGPHFGEEAPLVGRNGSGTVFFSGCSLNCTFCQNASISQLGEGREVSAVALASAMLSVQQMGCHNVNLVTPSHVTAQILEALCLAVEDGLRIPIVYNCGGYESPETLSLLDGVVDIYMPDFKFATSRPAQAYCDAPDYPDVVQETLRQMHRQVGDLVMDEEKIATHGLMVRHLVLPHDQSATARCMDFLASISRDTYVNVMSQYRPCHEARSDPVLGRCTTHAEHRVAIEAARRAGLHRIDDPLQRLRISLS